MSKQATRTARKTVTARLFELFDAVGQTLSVNFARDLAAAHKLNTTSAEIAFYNWRMARGFYVKGTPAPAR